jgi:hypothetical protein
MLSFLANLVISAIGIVLGAYILFFGRRMLAPTLGIIALAASGNLLANLFTAAETGGEMVAIGAWGWAAAAFAIAIAGAVIGSRDRELAVKLIGFTAGAGVALWLLDISTYLLSSVAHLSDRWTSVVAVALAVLGGLGGLWLVRVNRDEALILLAALIGAELIGDSFGLNPSSSFTAIILLSLVLAGVLTQYADYLREDRREMASRFGEPVASSVALIQELDLD